MIDNASGDEPVVAEAIAANGWQDWARVVVAPRNGGFAYGNNLGLKELERDGRVDFVHLLNPDTVLRAGAIDALVDFLDAHPKAGIAGGIFENGDGSEWAMAFRFPSARERDGAGTRLGIVSRLLARWRVPMQMGHAARAVDWVAGASMMVRREVFSASEVSTSRSFSTSRRRSSAIAPRLPASRSGTSRRAVWSISPDKARK